MELFIVAKYEILGIEKKLVKLGKNKECEEINQWIRSIVNHVYFSVISSPSDSPDLVQAKWLSLHNHICNKHSGHGKLYPKCQHPRLKKRDRQKAWLKKRKWQIKLKIQSGDSVHYQY